MNIACWEPVLESSGLDIEFLRFKTNNEEIPYSNDLTINDIR
jgi:hypothetical protein